MKIYERSGEAEGQKVGCVAGRGKVDLGRVLNKLQLKG